MATLLDVRQGEQLVYTATQTIADTDGAVNRLRIKISLLLGKNPAEVGAGAV